MMHDQELIFNTVTETPRTVKEIIAIAYPDKLESDQHRLINHTNRVLNVLVEDERINCTNAVIFGRVTRVFYKGTNPVQRIVLIPKDEMIMAQLSNEYLTTSQINRAVYEKKARRKLTDTRFRLTKLYEMGLIDSQWDRFGSRLWKLKDTSEGSIQ